MDYLNMHAYLLEIPGAPVGKARPRFSRKSGAAYTPAKTANYENLVKLAWAQEYPDARPVSGPVMVSIKAYFPIPQSAPKKKRAAMEAGEIRPTVKPDADNIAKSVCDALNGLAYDDDKQVVYLGVSKYYSDRPRVHIEIMREE